jgi:hypothetical protein
MSAVPAFAAQDADIGNAPLWFQFKVGRVADESNSYVTVTLDDQANCGGMFQIFASGSWSFWDTPSQEEWMGVGSKIDDDTYLWAGDVVPGTYYVRLGTGAHMPCTLGVSGTAVNNLQAVDYGYRPAPVVIAPPAAPEPAAMPAIAMAKAPLIAPAESMTEMVEMHEHMENIPGEWMHVMSNEPMVYEFKVGRPLEEEDGQPQSHVSIALHGEPYRSGEFQIFAGSGAYDANPQEGEWFGHSFEADGEYPEWHGDLMPGTYQVRVVPQGMRDCRLAVSGENVAW